MLEDPTGLEVIHAAGIRALPVVACGDDFVFGVDLEKVAELVGFSYDATPALRPALLIARYHLVLAAALRYAGQIPTDRLADTLPNRDRTYLALINHLVQIAADFLEIAYGADFTGPLATSVPQVNLGLTALNARAVELKDALTGWLQQTEEADHRRTVTTYFGNQTLHQVLERAVWHSAQHARQLNMILQSLAIVPSRPLTQADFRDLPMPEDVWDG